MSFKAFGDDGRDHRSFNVSGDHSRGNTERQQNEVRSYLAYQKARAKQREQEQVQANRKEQAEANRKEQDLSESYWNFMAQYPAKPQSNPTPPSSSNVLKEPSSFWRPKSSQMHSSGRISKLGSHCMAQDIVGRQLGSQCRTANAGAAGERSEYRTDYVRSRQLGSHYQVDNSEGQGKDSYYSGNDLRTRLEEILHDDTISEDVIPTQANPMAEPPYDYVQPSNEDNKKLQQEEEDHEREIADFYSRQRSPREEAFGKADEKVGWANAKIETAQISVGDIQRQMVRINDLCFHSRPSVKVLQDLEIHWSPRKQIQHRAEIQAVNDRDREHYIEEWRKDGLIQESLLEPVRAAICYHKAMAVDRGCKARDLIPLLTRNTAESLSQEHLEILNVFQALSLESDELNSIWLFEGSVGSSSLGEEVDEESWTFMENDND